MEIFERRREYFKVLFWSVSPPTIEELIDEPVSFGKIEKQYQVEAEKILRATKEDRDFYLGLLEKGVASEEEQRTVIDSKANSMISQTGVAVTLIVAGLSLVSLGLNDWIPKAVVMLLLAIAAMHLIAGGLHARLAVSLIYKYPRHDFTSYLGITQPSTDYIISQIYIIQRLSQLNMVKAGFLRFAHWFYKATFVTLFAITVLAPLLLFLISPHNSTVPNVVNIRNSNAGGIISNGAPPEIKVIKRAIRSSPKPCCPKQNMADTTGKPQ